MRARARACVRACLCVCLCVCVLHARGSASQLVYETTDFVRPELETSVVLEQSKEV